MIAFRALIGSEREIDWGNDIWTLHTNEKQGRDKMAFRLKLIQERLGGGELVMCFTGKGNFRKVIDPTYKLNRKATRKPLGYAAAVEWITTGEAKDSFGPYRPIVMDGLEADDVMGILATKPGNEGRCIIVSDDKDMQCIPTRVWRKPAVEEDAEDTAEDIGPADVEPRQIIDVSTEMADRFHLAQAMAGDTSDGYPGCPGVGMVTALELLDKGLKFEPYTKVISKGKRQGQEETAWERVAADNPWQTVVSCYLKAGQTEAQAITQARLARILRWSDWDHKRKEPILWQPK